MSEPVQEAREHFIQGVSRIAHFWGFPKATGAIYGAIYLSPEPMSLDEMVQQVGVSKGAVSTCVRHLQRLKMVHKKIKVGDRKDYYTAETDFWKIVKNILKEREKQEFDLALRTVGESLEILDRAKPGKDSQTTSFYKSRMKAMNRFFKSLDALVTMVLAIENLTAGTLSRVFATGGHSRKTKENGQ